MLSAKRLPRWLFSPWGCSFVSALPVTSWAQSLRVGWQVALGTAAWLVAWDATGVGVVLLAGVLQAAMASVTSAAILVDGYDLGPPLADALRGVCRALLVESRIRLSRDRLLKIRRIYSGSIDPESAEIGAAQSYSQAGQPKADRLLGAGIALSLITVPLGNCLLGR